MGIALLTPPLLGSVAKVLFKVNPLTREVLMSKPTMTTQTIPLDGRHICNHCLRVILRNWNRCCIARVRAMPARVIRW
jgi:hypothetical protein